MSLTGAHQISDSESDSDVTVDPDDSACHSPDLFEDDEPSSKTPTKAANYKMCLATTSKNSSSPLKRKSTVHEISDSDSDSGRNCSQKRLTSSHSGSNTSASTPPMPGIKPRPAKKLREHKPPEAKLQRSSTMDAVYLESTDEDSSDDEKPVCQYGSKCYRKNPSHFKEYRHPGRREERMMGAAGSSSAKVERMTPPKTARQSSSLPSSATPWDCYKAFQPLSLFLTKVEGIPKEHNSLGALNLRDILSPSMGNLEASCQFNFMFDVKWLMHQYPAEFRQKPVLLVQADKGAQLVNLQRQAAAFPSVSFCQARLDIPYGTHHTKMMFLLYDNGMRVVIHTANMVENDWHQKTQGAWVSPLFPKLAEGQVSGGGKQPGDSTTHFKRDLLRYLAAYRSPRLTPWEKHITAHDMSSARVRIIASVPGRHTGSDLHSWGHLKLRKVLQEQGPERSEVTQWPVVGQFSSIGSLGANAEAWLCGEWLQSLTATRGTASVKASSKLQLIYPSRHNVRTCLEGYCGGGCLPYSLNTAKKQPYLHAFMHQWKSAGRGRSRAIPHIKSYLRCSPSYDSAAWFLVTSANLSKAAWGSLEKKGAQLMIRSFELGVLFLPSDFECGKSFPISSRVDDVLQSSSVVLPLPYDLPPTAYGKDDRPWIMDIPYMDLPDTNGNNWCPPI